MRRLPPLSSLRAFEAAARNLSFKRAAEELHVSATAVSHQIRQLENFLGAPLFERRTRQVLMTEAAQRLYPVLRDGFDAFAAAIGAVEKLTAPSAVTVTTTRALAAHWLVPRISRFQANHPDIDLRLLATDNPVSLVGGEADLAIRYGGSSSTGLSSALLFEDQFMPFVRPGVEIPDDFAGISLIDYDWSSPSPGRPSWARWFAASGISVTEQRRVVGFNDETHAVLAAIGGQGVALLSTIVAADAVSAGTLVAVSSYKLPGQSYYLVHRDGPLTDVVKAVRDWVTEELKNTWALSHEATDGTGGRGTTVPF